MSRETQLINIDDFKTNNSKGIEDFYETLYKTSVDAVLSNSFDSLIKSLEIISKSFEKISNYLDLENSHNLACFYFGSINTITNVVFDIAEDNNESHLFTNISKSYRLLVPALEIIKKYSTISGTDLQKELNLKSSSNLSNFLKRIEKYELVSVRKIGTVNYISLTYKGEKFLSSNQDYFDKSDSMDITVLFRVLDGLSEQLSKNNPSSLELVHNCAPTKASIREKRLLKQKFDYIFYVRDNYFRSKFENNNKWDAKTTFSSDIFCDEITDDTKRKQVYSY